MYHLVNFVRCNIPVKFQKHCFIIGGDILNFVSHHGPCTTDDVISDQICIIGKLEYLWNKKRYHKKENTILVYFESLLNYLLNDIKGLYGESQVDVFNPLIEAGVLPFNVHGLFKLDFYGTSSRHLCFLSTKKRK